MPGLGLAMCQPEDKPVKKKPGLFAGPGFNF
jgi:hypothetical protein